MAERLIRLWSLPGDSQVRRPAAEKCPTPAGVPLARSARARFHREVPALARAGGQRDEDDQVCPSVAVILREVAALENAARYQLPLIGTTGERTVHKTPELSVRKTTLSRHQAHRAVTDVGASSAMGSHGPNTSQPPALRVIAELGVAPFAALEALLFQSRLYLAPLQRHGQKPNRWRT